MTDDSEVREGDVREKEEFAGFVKRVGPDVFEADFRRDDGSKLHLRIDARLIRRKAQEIKVGSRVLYRDFCGTVPLVVDAISEDGRFAYLRRRATYGPLPEGRVPLSNLTLVEDQTDG